jgi:type III pantothenate kinase
MATIVVDVGNTRIKWARVEGGRPGATQAAAHQGWTRAQFARRLFGRGVESALVASVAGAAVDRELARAAQRAGTRLRFLRVPRRGGGLRVGYLEPWRLGVDRFAAMVGARQLFPGVPVCVAGVGTALTLDLVGARGRHWGGAIIPAPALMVATLLERTSGIRCRAQGGRRAAVGLFGRSTRDAIEQGALYAAAAAIDRAVEEGAQLLGRRPLVVLHGGGAPQVRPLVHSPCVGVADLTLRGLAVLSAGLR